MKHVILLGDSIFDNIAYVANGPDVRTQLQQGLAQEWRVTLLAADGSRMQEIPTQLAQLPDDATHLVVSVGGNNVLGLMGLRYEAVSTMGEALEKLYPVAAAFQEQYHQMVQTILSHARPTALCTIYYPNFAEQATQNFSVAALALFNDCIIREAFSAGLPLIDLRLVCTEDADYANPIEPSAVGGAKIANVIARVLLEHNFAGQRTEVFL